MDMNSDKRVVASDASLIRSPTCPACDAAERRPYYRHETWELFSCEVCRLIYLDPMPGPATLATIYHDAYNGAQTGYFTKTSSKLRRSSKRLRIIRRFSKTSGGNFLDVGCNGGFMVEAARRVGYTAWGIDPDLVSLEYARAHFPDSRYFHGVIDEFDPRDSVGAAVRFDMAYCSEVIEHVPQPQAFLRDINRLLKPGGVLYLTTPDISHWRRPRRLENWDGFCPPSHLLYFSPENLIALARRSGFELLSRRPAWKPGVKLVLQRPQR